MLIKYIYRTAQEESRILPKLITEDEESGLLSSETCAIIHGSLLGGLFFFGIIRSVSFYRSAIRSSQKLHDDMFHGMVGAPMRFFDTNPSGRILNR